MIGERGTASGILGILSGMRLLYVAYFDGLASWEVFFWEPHLSGI